MREAYARHSSVGVQEDFAWGVEYLRRMADKSFVASDQTPVPLFANNLTIQARPDSECLSYPTSHTGSYRFCRIRCPVPSRRRPAEQALAVRLRVQVRRCGRRGWWGRSRRWGRQRQKGKGGGAGVALLAGAAGGGAGAPGADRSLPWRRWRGHNRRREQLNSHPQAGKSTQRPFSAAVASMAWIPDPSMLGLFRWLFPSRLTNSMLAAH